MSEILILNYNMYFTLLVYTLCLLSTYDQCAICVYSTCLCLVWCAGTEAGLRLYLAEVVALAQMALTSQSWPIKAQGAATLSAVASKLGDQLGPPHLGTVMAALTAGLVGRTWTGKVGSHFAHL